uniref:Uncharacterized protein n=1 Tax=Candidatus Kentrum eta TaxID=2126337 RepID=A0A450V6G9_9GAMM|nr:MAG: hypothetical protein BECKH772A_GA0070896_101822 [Candidatus Kentron sp. H]VFK00370.1 MAG: hypothetical protein BECKH772B_GA0070898_101882 [Candidatus Kentron sp. H]VFK04464.1 MAG: hypothetical protein BECKH772C_GA0070978_101831 [Candidatus Kentron sp. H]
MDLWSANLSGIESWKSIASIQGANILHVESPPEGFRAWALEKGAVEMDPDMWKKSVK